MVKEFKMMFVYDNEKVVACIMVVGDGTYIDFRNKLRIAVTKEFEYMVFNYLDKRFVTLFNALEQLDKTFITEKSVVDYINSKTDFRATYSVTYEYPYHKLSNRVFNNILRGNDMIDFETLRGVD